MTDLEDAWNRYPVGRAPVTRLMQEGRKRPSRATGPALGGLVAAGIAVGLVITLNPNSQPPSAGPTSTYAAQGPAVPFKIAAFKADLHPATSCAQLLGTYRKRGLSQVTAYGWNGGIMFDGIRHEPMVTNGPELGPRPAAAQASVPVAGQVNSATGTNVQEVGVDEPDIVKTNGSLLVRIDDATLGVYDVTGTSPHRVATFALPYFSQGQILMSGSTVIALGNDSSPSAAPNGGGTRVETVSLADPAHPAITSDITYSGAITSARQHGTTIRLVMASGLPPLPFVQPDAQHTFRQALTTNRNLVARSTLTQWLPTVDQGNGPKGLLDCTNVAITPSTVPLGTTSIVGFDAASPTAYSAIGLSGQTSIAYESTDHLYLTGAGTQMGYCMCPRIGPATPSGDRTAIFQFDLVGDEASHVATGTVDGSIADRWSMDEVGGILRAATTQYGNSTQTSSVITLKQSGTSLVQVGRLDGLGRGETLTAARWFDGFAVISTAAQVDPLFTVDLTDPTHPKLLGALHIPGYSTYFHPLGNGQLLGVGQKVAFNSTGEDSVSQVGLFDISDLRNVHRLSVASLPGWTRPTAGDDPRTFTWLPDHATALTSFTTQGTQMLLGEFTIVAGHVQEKTISVAASDPSTVRTMELPSGKVVLMAGGAVSFLSL